MKPSGHSSFSRNATIVVADDNDSILKNMSLPMLEDRLSTLVGTRSEAHYR